MLTLDASNGRDPSGWYLEARLELLLERVRAAVERRRADDPDPDDRFRGLYVSEADVDRLLDGAVPTTGPAGEAMDAYLAELEETVDRVEAEGQWDVRPRRVREAFRLDAIDLDLLIAALAPDLDPRFERLYGYLHDDVSRRRCSVGLALELAARRSGADRRRLTVGGPLVANRLLHVEDRDRPFLTRSLRVPDRVQLYLLGDDHLHPAVEQLVGPVESQPGDDAEAIARALRTGARLVYLREPVGGAAAAVAAAALEAAGSSALPVDLGRLAPSDDVADVAARVAREATLLGRGVVAGPIEALADRGAEAVRAVAEARSCVILFGTRGWDPRWSREVPLVRSITALPAVARARAWERHLSTVGDAHQALAQYRLTPEQIGRAASAAEMQAIADGQAVGIAHLTAGARAQNSAGLERLARRIEPVVDLDDLVLTAAVRRQLRELVGRVRHRDDVLDEWGMGRRSSKGRGVKALFSGDSGTGKTVSAEAIARDIGLDLYVIDLSTVVDKYVGETEKNLDRIFVEADRVNGVLLFDEADALFGKRSEVKDAQDRYANVEVAYLLQRMELFEGLAILTTNLRSNIDEAFARRLDVIVDFPMPEADDRLLLWERNLSSGVPRGRDLDLGFLAASFKLSGGNIRNIAVAAALLAAGDGGRPVVMSDLVRATESEYRKLGRLCLEDEFGPYFSMVGG